MTWSPAIEAPEARWVEVRYRTPFGSPTTVMTAQRRGDRWWRAPRGRVGAPHEWRPLPRRGRPRDWTERMSLANGVRRHREVSSDIPFDFSKIRDDRTRMAGWFVAASAYGRMHLRENKPADRDGYMGGVAKMLAKHGDPNPRWWAKECARRIVEVLAQEAEDIARLGQKA